MHCYGASRRSDDSEFPVDIVYEFDLTGCSPVIGSPSSDGDETRLRCGTREVEQPSSLKLTAIREGAVREDRVGDPRKVYPARQSHQFGFLNTDAKTWVLAHEVLVADLSDVVGGNHDIAEALPPREKESNVPAFNRAR